MAKTTTEALKHVNVGLSTGRLEFEGSPLAPLGTDATAIALLIVNLGKIVALKNAKTKIDTTSQGIAVRIITLAEAANKRRTEEH